MKPVYLVDGRRTPQARAGTALKDVPPQALGYPLVRAMLDTAGLEGHQVDEVVFGNVGQPSEALNIARVIALEAGLPQTISSYTVQRNCASGLEALAQAFVKIQSERARVMVAGGVESMSQMPLLYSPPMAELFVNVLKAKTPMARLKALKSFRPSHLRPVVALEQGLTDPFCGQSMGQTAETLARELGISREQQDARAHRSHQRAIVAMEEGRFDREILPLPSGPKLSRFLRQDQGPRKDSSLEKLAQMKPYFDRKHGSVTVGNSCPITDGGSALLVASQEAVKQYQLSPMARVVDFAFVGLDPARMGMGPLVAIDALLKKVKMSLEEMDLVEINEAFAAQVLAVERGLEDSSVAQCFGVDRVWGKIPEEKFNVNGGALALGHPVGSTGARLVVTLASELARRGLKWGLAAICIGGGQGGACLIENLERP